jgi:hypothetical protein
MHNFLRVKLIVLFVFTLSRISYGQNNTIALFQVNSKVNYVIGNDNYEEFYFTKVKPSLGLNIDIGIRKVYKRKVHIDYLLSYNDFQIVENERELIFYDPIDPTRIPTSSFGGGLVDYTKYSQFKSIDFLVYTGMIKEISSNLAMVASVGGGIGYLVESRILQTFKSKDKSYEYSYTDYSPDYFERINYFFGIKCGLEWKLKSRLSANLSLNYVQNVNTIYADNRLKVFPNATGLTLGIGYLLKSSKKADK